MEKKNSSKVGSAFIQKSLRSGPANSAFFAQKNKANEGVLTFDNEEIKYVEGADADSEVITQESGTSKEYKPLKLAWFFDEKDFILNEDGTTKLTLRDEYKELKSKLAISQCPGKKIERGRDGKTYDRNIYQDVEYYR